MAKTVVTKKQLLKMDGVAEALSEIEKRLDRATGNEIKKALIEGGKPLWRQAKQNIAGLGGVSKELKAILSAEVSMMRGKAKQPKILVGMSQLAGIKKLGRGGRFIPSPYWFEFGTAQRVTKTGHRTGAITPTPFFRDAISKSKTAVREALAASLKALLVEK